jgi:hypothetical protein
LNIVQIEGTEVEWTLGFALAEECRLSRQAANSMHNSTEPDDNSSDEHAPFPAPSSSSTSAHPTVCKMAMKASSMGKRVASGAGQMATGVRNNVAAAVQRILVQPVRRLLEKIVECWQRTKEVVVGLWKWPIRKQKTEPEAVETKEK